MVDDRLAEAQSSPDAGRTKREGPTIELEATEVSSKAPDPRHEPEQQRDQSPEPPHAAASASEDARSGKPISPWVIAPVSGAVAAALVIAVGWILGWPNVQAPPPAPQVTAASVDDLTSRVASLEGKINKPNPAEAVVPGSFLKPVKDLRDEVAALRAQSDKLAGSVNELKAAPHDASPGVDLSALNERIDKLEGASRVQSDAIASEKAAESKPADDMPLRRVVAAALLDVAVRHGDPYTEQLAAAKSQRRATQPRPRGAAACRRLACSPRPSRSRSRRSAPGLRLRACRCVRSTRKDRRRAKHRAALPSVR